MSWSIETDGKKASMESVLSTRLDNGNNNDKGFTFFTMHLDSQSSVSVGRKFAFGVTFLVCCRRYQRREDIKCL